jgi:hypothetical protein
MEFSLDGAIPCREQLIRDNPGPRAVLNALDRLVDGYGSDIRYLKSDIAVEQGQLKDCESHLGKPFAHDAFQRELTDLRDRLKLGLSEHAAEGLTPVAELAKKIQSLQEANTFDVSPLSGEGRGKRCCQNGRLHRRFGNVWESTSQPRLWRGSLLSPL